MAVRIRKSGEIVCAAMYPALPGDIYLHDGLHYTLSVELGALVTDNNHIDGHGQWWWANEVPSGVTPDPFYAKQRAAL